MKNSKKRRNRKEEAVSFFGCKGISMLNICHKQKMTSNIFLKSVDKNQIVN